MIATSDDVKQAIHSFTPGSAGGADGLRPQHLSDMTDERVGGALLDALTDFTNLVLNGGVPTLARRVFFGATLISFNKKAGGIRPIAVGLTLRRLAAKVANRRALQTCSSLLAPRHLGVGVKGGAEAIAHAAKRYLASTDSDKVLIKLDFANAFNCIRRDAVLEAVALHIPEVLAFANSAYGSVTNYDAEIESFEGKRVV